MGLVLILTVVEPPGFAKVFLAGWFLVSDLFLLVNLVREGEFLVDLYKVLFAEVFFFFLVDLSGFFLADFFLVDLSSVFLADFFLVDFSNVLNVEVTCVLHEELIRT